MGDTTFEEAKRCPQCGMPGSEVNTQRVRRDTGEPATLKTIRCETRLCDWFHTVWIVQVNQDGSIPEPGQYGPKQFPKLSPESETRVREAMQAQLDAETRPGGGEIRR